MGTPEIKYLVLEVKPTRLMSVEDFMTFMKGLEQYDVNYRDEIRVVITAEGFLKFAVPVTVKPLPKKTPLQRAAEKQIAERKKAVAAGIPVPGHVEPARPKRKIKVKKNWRTA